MQLLLTVLLHLVLLTSLMLLGQQGLCSTAMFAIDSRHTLTEDRATLYRVFVDAVQTSKTDNLPYGEYGGGPLQHLCYA